jgi:hypothetical protein
VKWSPDASAPKGLTPQPPTHPSNAAPEWQAGVLGDEDSHAVAAQVHGGVREWQGRQVQEAATPSQ